MTDHVRVCRECGEEYRPEIVRCADCGGELEDHYDGQGVASPAPPDGGGGEPSSWATASSS